MGRIRSLTVAVPCRRFGRVRNGFVWENVAELAEAFEVFDGAAVLALGLGLVAEEEAPSGGGFGVHVVEALGEEVVAVLDLHFGGIDVEFFVEGNDGGFVFEVEEDAVEGGGEEAGFKARYPEYVVLGEGDAFDGEEFLGVRGRVGGDGVGAEAVNGVAVFDFDDGEVGTGEGVLAGVLRCSALAGGGAGAGGFGGVGSVGGELFVGCHAMGLARREEWGGFEEVRSCSEERRIRPASACHEFERNWLFEESPSQPLDLLWFWPPPLCALLIAPLGTLPPAGSGL